MKKADCGRPQSRRKRCEQRQSAKTKALGRKKGSRQEERRSAGAKAIGRNKGARQEERRSAETKAIGRNKGARSRQLSCRPSLIARCGSFGCPIFLRQFGFTVTRLYTCSAAQLACCPTFRLPCRLSAIRLSRKNASRFPLFLLRHLPDSVL